eukprot:gnl/Trimastix_PCT/2221.p1 GENE.gnl/Trimastix_PCT/2221~~gnl/Trimastix_PCT/2221.p1  ORF type:complete len:531 (+),score=134.31 gnl/Trimastix_PCT/2221:73-1593(+)
MGSHIADWIVRVVVFAIVAAACIIDLCHNPLKHRRKFVNFRFLNWFLVGMTYAGTYFARYNMNVANTDKVRDLLGCTKTQFGWVITVGFIAYAAFVVINGFMVDKLGGRFATLLGSFGSAICNVALGIFAAVAPKNKPTLSIVIICLLYAVNNFFQTFCTCAICKVGVNWYNTRERGFFSGIFGVIISFGFYLAFQINGIILAHCHWCFIFFIPAMMLVVLCTIDVFIIRSTPADAGFIPVDDDALRDYHEKQALLSAQKDGSLNADDTPAKEEEKKSDGYGLSFIQLFKKVFMNPIFMLFCVIDLQVGWCRDGILSWYPDYLTKYWHVGTGSDPYALASGGVTLGGMFGSLSGGIFSDLIFKSRRPPIALIALLSFIGCLVFLYFSVNVWMSAIGIGLCSFFFSSVHGIITSTCAMDFAGSKATGTAVGLLDGVQKVGSAMTGAAMAAIITNWSYHGWLISMMPAAGIGAFLVLFILHKKPPAKPAPLNAPTCATVPGIKSEDHV